MMLRLAAVFALLLPGFAQAQEVSVRSGEHADFSRLVLEFAERVTWEFGRVEGGYELRAQAPGATYDLARVFDLIPRTRISGVQDLGGGRLFIQSDCDCHGDAFDLRASAVVLDIKNGGAPRAGSPFNNMLPDIAVVSPADDQAQDPAARRPLLPDMAPREARAGLPITFGIGHPLPDPPPPPPVAEIPAPEDTPAEPIPMPDGSGVAEAEDAEPSARVSETEQALLRQMGRAAAQGLLMADTSPTDAAIDMALNPVPQDAPDLPPSPEDAPTEPAQPHDPTEHMHIQTVVDRDLGLGITPAEETTEDGLACLPASHFNIADWGTPPTDGADLSLHRAALLGEFDQANQEHVLGQLRNYLYLTFGAEAAAMARRFESDLERPDLLIMIAEIMDHGQSSIPGAFQDQLACNGPVALWATLAQHELPSGATIDSAAITKAFSELPLHLRRHLGPDLSRKLLEYGDLATAGAIRDAIARAPGDHGEAFDLLEARLEISQGDHARAKIRLDEIINADGPVAPEAVLAYLQASQEEGLVAAARVREIATAMAFERRGTEIGAKLTKAVVAADTSAGDFHSAAVLIEETGEEASAAGVEITELSEIFFASLLEKADDAEFLMRTVPQVEKTRSLPVDLRRGIVERLLELGFAPAARAALSDPQQVPGPEERLLFARVALLEGSPGVAMGYLAGLETVEALQIRAAAQSALSDHSGASQSWTMTDNPERARAASWLAGNWNDLEHADGSPYQGVAQILARPIEPTLGSEPAGEGVSDTTAMSRSHDALGRSQETRAVLRDLLEHTSKP